MNLGEPDVLCDCGGTFYTPTKVREEVERAQQEAYAEGRKDERECSSDHCEFQKDAERYRLIRAALLSSGPEWAKLAAMLNIAPDTAQGVDDAVDATFLMEATDGTR